MKLGEINTSMVTYAVQKREKDILRLLPCGDACQRIATNFLTVAELSLLVSVNRIVNV